MVIANMIKNQMQQSAPASASACSAPISTAPTLTAQQYDELKQLEQRKKLLQQTMHYCRDLTFDYRAAEKEAERLEAEAVERE